MATAYSIDIRQKILSAWQNKEDTQRELAARFKVSLSFISGFFRQYRETGEIAPKPQGGDRRSLIKGKEEELLKKIVTEQNDIYLREIQAVHYAEDARVLIESVGAKVKFLPPYP